MQLLMLIYGYRILRSPRFVSSGCFYREERVKLIKMAMNDDRDRTIWILILKESDQIVVYIRFDKNTELFMYYEMV